MPTVSYVYARFQVEGFHYFAAAPEEVSFLRTRHRHMFHFKVGIEVRHDDREIEFIMLKRELENYFKEESVINDKSCEMLARLAISYLMNKYKNEPRNIWAEVSEDGENGAIVEYDHVPLSYLGTEEE